LNRALSPSAISPPLSTELCAEEFAVSLRNLMRPPDFPRDKRITGQIIEKGHTFRIRGVKLCMDSALRAAGTRTRHRAFVDHGRYDEVTRRVNSRSCVPTQVKDGEIVLEQFFYVAPLGGAPQYPIHTKAETWLSHFWGCSIIRDFSTGVQHLATKSRVFPQAQCSRSQNQNRGIHSLTVGIIPARIRRSSGLENRKSEL